MFLFEVSDYPDITALTMAYNENNSGKNYTFPL